MHRVNMTIGEFMAEEAIEDDEAGAVVTIMGIDKAGSNFVHFLSTSGLQGAEFIVADTAIADTP